MYGGGGRPRASSDLITTWNLHLYWVHTPPAHASVSTCQYVSCIVLKLHQHCIYDVFGISNLFNTRGHFSLVILAITPSDRYTILSPEMQRGDVFLFESKVDTWCLGMRS